MADPVVQPRSDVLPSWWYRLARNIPRNAPYQWADFPSAFAANDPRFNIPVAKPTGRGPPIGTLLGRALPGILSGAAFLAELIAEKEIRQRELDIEGGFEALRIKRRRLQREKELREVVVRGDVAGLPTEQLPQRPDAVQPVRMQAIETGTIADLSGGRGVEINVVRPTIDPGAITSPNLPVGEPVRSEVILPGLGASTLPAQGAFEAAQELSSEIAQEIATSAPPQSVFGQPAQITWPSSPVQPSAPGLPGQPLFPVRWAAPGTPLTPIRPVRVASPLQDPFGLVEQFPEPVPNPATDPARNRCKPCKEDNPKPRDACFKGLYREGPLDTQVDFVEWAEIDCVTGVEL